MKEASRRLCISIAPFNSVKQVYLVLRRAVEVAKVTVRRSDECRYCILEQYVPDLIQIQEALLLPDGAVEGGRDARRSLRS